MDVGGHDVGVEDHHLPAAALFQDRGIGQQVARRLVAQGKKLVRHQHDPAGGRVACRAGPRREAEPVADRRDQAGIVGEQAVLEEAGPARPVHAHQEKLAAHAAIDVQQTVEIRVFELQVEQVEQVVIVAQVAGDRGHRRQTQDRIGIAGQAAHLQGASGTLVRRGMAETLQRRLDLP